MWLLSAMMFLINGWFISSLWSIVQRLKVLPKRISNWRKRRMWMQTVLFTSRYKEVPRYHSVCNVFQNILQRWSIHDLYDLSFLGVSIEALALRFREFATGDDRTSCVLKSIQNLFNKDFKGIRIKSMQQTFIRDIMGILLHQSCFQFTLEGSTYCTCTYFTSEPTN